MAGKISFDELYIAKSVLKVYNINRVMKENSAAMLISERMEESR